MWGVSSAKVEEMPPRRRGEPDAKKEEWSYGMVKGQREDDASSNIRKNIFNYYRRTFLVRFTFG